MTIYIVFMFLGAGIASWLGTSAYDVWGWTGNAGLAFAMSLISVTLSVFAYRWKASSEGV